MVPRYSNLNNLCGFGSSVGLHDFFNVVLGSHHNRNTLVDILGCDFHDSLGSSGGNTSGLFHDKRHRSSLVQQSELSVDVFGVSGVSENTSVEQSTVDITDHGSNVSAREGRSRLSGSILPSGNDLLEGFVPHVCVGLVERHDGRSLRDLHVGVTQDEFSKIFIEGESIGTGTKGQNEKGGGGVQAVSSGNQVGSSLKGVGKAIQFLGSAVFSDAAFVHGAVFIVLIDSNNGSGGNTGINVRGSIQRIENSNVFVGFGEDSILVGVDEVKRNIFLFRSQNSHASSESKSTLKDFVGNNIKLLLVLTLDIDLSLVSKSIGGWQLGSLDHVSDGLAGSVDGTEKSGQLLQFRVEHGNLIHVSLEGDTLGFANLVQDRGLQSVHGRRDGVGRSRDKRGRNTCQGGNK
mmetsp:Transcript_12297/g.25395  ORF Transcript_12297/g.25395 Transcript_12297/m.25395 type:complete len:404 (-) Transcript_12297:56-1267(-)